MTISPTLMKAILAMDSYNRNYFEGVEITSGPAIGDANILFDSQSLGILVDGNGNPILDGNNQPIRKDMAAGFYAIAYQLSDGSVVISYRGTDQFLDGGGVGGDILNSYFVGGGDADEAQSRLAIEFYKTVAAAINPSNPDPYAANISVTGHSSGGGLAGLVGAIYHKTGVLFDNMAFKDAASSLSNWKHAGNDPLHPLENLYPKEFYQLINGTNGPVLNNDFGQTFDSRWLDGGQFKADWGGLTSYVIEGEILEQDLIPIPGGNTFQRNEVPTYELSLHADVSWFNLIGDNGIDPFDAHSVSTQVIRMFAGTDATQEAAFGNAWYSSAPYFWKVMYDNAFSQSIGVGVVDGGRYPYSWSQFRKSCLVWHYRH